MTALLHLHQHYDWHLVKYYSPLILLKPVYSDKKNDLHELGHRMSYEVLLRINGYNRAPFQLQLYLQIFMKTLQQHT